MIVVLGDVDVAPDNMAEALAISRAHVERSRTEPGCISHDVLTDPDHPHRLVFVERWEDRAALDRHYASGPPVDWRDDFVSAYAAAHPSEDWAECWGHYLHIYDALDTAWSHGLLATQPAVMTMAERLAAWSRISLMLNELNRSVGRGDAYPFVINESVAEKLELIETTIQRLRTLR